MGGGLRRTTCNTNTTKCIAWAQSRHLKSVGHVYGQDHSLHRFQTTIEFLPGDKKAKHCLMEDITKHLENLDSIIKSINQFDNVEFARRIYKPLPKTYPSALDDVCISSSKSYRYIPEKNLMMWMDFHFRKRSHAPKSIFTAFQNTRWYFIRYNTGGFPYPEFLPAKSNLLSTHLLFLPYLAVSNQKLF
jgi:hypothetical protein